MLKRSTLISGLCKDKGLSFNKLSKALHTTARTLKKQLDDNTISAVKVGKITEILSLSQSDVIAIFFK